MPTVTEITSADSLESLRLPWNALWMQSSRRQFTQSFDWFQAYWHAFAGGRRLHVLVVASQGRPIGILPLACTVSRTALGNECLLASAAQHPEACGGVIGPNVAATYMSAIRHLEQRRGEWHELRLENLFQQGEASRCATALQLADLPCTRKSPNGVLEIDLTPWAADADSPQCGDDPRTRFQHYAPAGAAQGEGEPDWNVFDACVEIDHSRLRPETPADCESLLHESRRQFGLETFAAGVKHGQLEVGLLWHGPLPIAYCFSYRDEQGLTCWRLRRRGGAGGEDAERKLLHRVLLNSAASGARFCRLVGTVRNCVPANLGTLKPTWSVSSCTRSFSGRMWQRLVGRRARTLQASGGR